MSGVALVWTVVAQAAEGAASDVVSILLEGIGAGSPLAVLLSGTRFGQIAIGRAIVVALLAVSAVSTRDHRRTRPDQVAGSRRWAATALLASLLSATVSLNSHSAAQPITSGALLADWLHLVAMGTWIGGLITLTLTVARVDQSKPQRDFKATSPSAIGHLLASAPRVIYASAMVARFSPLAAVCVTTIVVSGAWQSWILVGSVDAVLGTNHGWALMLKLAIVGAMLAVAGINLVYTRPALAREAALAHDRGEPIPGAVSVLEAVSGVVEVLMMGVLLVTGAMTQLPPAREAYAEATRGTFREATVDGVRLRLRLNPGRPGYNVATLWATDRSAVLAGASARLVVRMTDHEMGEAEVRLTTRPDGSHVAGTGVVSMSGTYEVEAIVRREGRDDVRATFPAIAYDATAIDEAVIAALRQAPTEARAVRNPVASTAESLDRGRTIYLQSCAACHGITGKGDGAAAAAIRPALPDLTVHVGQHTEGELWWFITNGIAGRPMPAWRDVLTEDERWDVVNYLRAAFMQAEGAKPSALNSPRDVVTPTGQ
jgi:putative copper export protein/mono/diheme cytochrome c family protein